MQIISFHRCAFYAENNIKPIQMNCVITKNNIFVIKNKIEIYINTHLWKWWGKKNSAINRIQHIIGAIRESSSAYTFYLYFMLDYHSKAYPISSSIFIIKFINCTCGWPILLISWWQKIQFYDGGLCVCTEQILL